MKRAHRLSCLLAIAALAGSLVGGCKHGAPKADASTPPPAMLVGAADAIVVARGRLVSGPSLSGTLTPQRQASVRAQIGGSVLSTVAEPGQRVSSGEILARLDAAALADARSSALLAVSNAKSALALAQRDDERQKTLYAAGAVAQRDTEAAHQTVVMARANLAQAQAQLASAGQQLSHTAVTAPFAGVVSEKLVSTGDVVQPGASLYTVVDPESLQLEAAVPAEQVGALAIGMPVEFVVNGYGGRVFTGRITRINPTADAQTRQVRVYAELPNAEGRLVGGLFAEGRVASESREALSAPAEAIDRRLGRPAVLKVAAGKVQRVEVELGLADERAQRVEIKRGVAAGDVLLVGAAQQIAPGTAVRLDPAVLKREQAVEAGAQVQG